MVTARPVPWTASFGVVMRRAASGYLQPAESADLDHSIPYAIGGHTTSSSGRRPRDTFTSQLRPAGYSPPTSPALVPELKIANNGDEPSEIVTGAHDYSAKMPGWRTRKPTHLPFSLRGCVSGVASRYGASATNSSVCRRRRSCGTDARPIAGQGRDQRCGPGKAR